MELVLFAKVLMRRWWLVLLPVAVAAVIVVPDMLKDGPTAPGGYTTVLRYTAAQVLEAIPQRDGDYQDVWLASELTVNAFSEWVRSSRFKDEVAVVAAEAGVTINLAALSIAADNERSIGQIFISWSNDAELAVIAQAVVEVLQTRSQDYFPQLGDAPARVTLLDTPHIVPTAPPLADRFGSILRLGVALIAGVGLALLAEYLDSALRERQDLERLGLRVIGTIPRR